MTGDQDPQPISDILAAYRQARRQAFQRTPAAPTPRDHTSTLDKPRAELLLREEQGTPVVEASPRLAAKTTEQTPGRWDVDLSEFPIFRYHKNRLAKHNPREPLTYADTITGKDAQPVNRAWKLYAGAFGFGGASTQALLFDLFQLYAEQGFRGTQIQFGTLRALFQRRGNRNPSARDYARLRRDIDILRGYDFHCQNAFWDRQKQAYVDMRWGLFGAVFYFKEKPNDAQQQLPFGFIEVSPVLQQIARTRGFFALGFDSHFFHSLKPLEQRLAIYLARKFLSQQLHRRFVDDLARALPIEANRPDNVRMILRQTVEGLRVKGLPILESFQLEKSRDGRWLAVFHRKQIPKQDAPLPKYAAEELAPAVEALVDRIIEATGNAEDRPWWTQCAKRLGQGGIDRALGQLKETCQLNKVESRGAMLSKILKDIATETGLSLWDTPRTRIVPESFQN